MYPEIIECVCGVYNQVYESLCEIKQHISGVYDDVFHSL